MIWFSEIRSVSLLPVKEVERYILPRSSGDVAFATQMLAVCMQGSCGAIDDRTFVICCKYELQQRQESVQSVLCWQEVAEFTVRTYTL